MSDVENEIWHAVTESNRAWVSGDPHDVAPFFHENVSLIGPDFDRALSGRGAMTQVFLDYCRQAKTDHFEEHRPVVDVYGNTAIVTYGFSVKFTVEGTQYERSGQEMLVLVRDSGPWQIVWRTQVRGSDWVSGGV